MPLVLQSGRCLLSEKKIKIFVDHLIDGAWSKNGDKLFLDYAFMPLPGIVDIELTLDYPSQLLLLFAYMPLWKNMFLPHSACSCDCTPYLCDST